MIEVKQHTDPAIVHFGPGSIGVAAQQKAGKQTGTVGVAADFRERWPLIRKMQLFALIGNTHVEIEFVEARLDDDRSLPPIVCRDRIDELNRSVACPLDNVGPRAPRRTL